MKSIVERLRKRADDPLSLEAANEIERLQVECGEAENPWDAALDMGRYAAAADPALAEPRLGDTSLCRHGQMRILCSECGAAPTRNKSPSLTTGQAPTAGQRQEGGG